MKDWIQLIKDYWIGIVLSIVALTILNFLFGYVCPSVILTGFPCPACGITRALKLMLTGNIAASWEMHPLLILIIIGFVLYPILKKILKNYCNFIKLYVIICLVIFAIFYIYRMKMFFPGKVPMVYHKDNVMVKIYTYFHHIRQQK